MKPKVNILISGLPKVGKTTVALEIARFFETLGMTVTLDDGEGYTTDLQLALQPKRLDAIKAKDLIVDIKTVCLRESRPLRVNIGDQIINEDEHEGLG